MGSDSQHFCQPTVSGWFLQDNAAIPCNASTKCAPFASMNQPVTDVNIQEAAAQAVRPYKQLIGMVAESRTPTNLILMSYPRDKP